MRRKCIDCHTVFDDGGYSWKVRCIDCFKVHKRREEGGNYRNHYRPPPPPPRPARDPDVAWLRENVKKIIQLCHPDKHGNSEVSNDITKKLIAIYKG